VQEWNQEWDICREWNEIYFISFTVADQDASWQLSRIHDVDGSYQSQCGFYNVYYDVSTMAFNFAFDVSAKFNLHIFGTALDPRAYILQAAPAVVCYSSSRLQSLWPLQVLPNSEITSWDKFCLRSAQDKSVLVSLYHCRIVCEGLPYRVVKFPGPVPWPSFTCHLQTCTLIPLDCHQITDTIPDQQKFSTSTSAAQKRAVSPSWLWVWNMIILWW